MNIIIPPKTVAGMRNIIAVFISLALIWMFTPEDGYGLVFLCWCIAPACFLIVMVATQREILAGILFAVGYISIDFVKIKLEPDHFAQNGGWQDFLGLCLCTSIFSLMGTTPVYLWRRWRRRQRK